MTAEVQQNATPEGVQPKPPPPSSFFRQFLRLAAPYWNSEEKWKVRGLTALLVALTILQVFTPIMVNLWSARLFDALEQRSMDRFLSLIGALAFILVYAMAVTAIHLWIKRRLQLGWRRWLTKRVLNSWMEEGRHYQVTHIPGEHDNPDGRISEDIRNSTEAAIDLAHSLVYCLLLLLSFTQILWSLSGIVSLELADLSIPIPGHMVWVALLYASAGTTAAMLIGRPLVKAANKRQTYEANFRFGLVRARENSEAIALSHGEHDERRRLIDLFGGVATGWNRQTTALCNVFLFSSGYSVLATAFPILVASPRYIAGTITLGMLMQTAQAFQQMAAALSWPIDNLSRAAEWRAGVERVLVLHNALEMIDEDRAQAGHSISLEPGGDSLTFSELCIASPDGEVMVSRFNARISEGEKVLITGDPGAALKLFKVVAGLWPWGRGLVELPDDGANIFFMPHRPYLPIGKLRGAISYPTAPDWFEDDQFVTVLNRVGLGHLAQRLEDDATWEKELAYGDMQRLGFARLLLQRPDWIFIEEATDAIDPDGEREMMRLLRDDFPAATVITVGNHPSLEDFHDRKLVLSRSTDGLVLVNEARLLRKANTERPHWLGRFLTPLVKRKIKNPV